MNNNLSVSKSIVINANVSKIWEALTNPAIIKKYLFGTETITDWKPGSEIIFQGEYEGTQYRDHGVILENFFHKSLSYSYWSGFSGLEDTPENYATVTYNLGNIDDINTNFTWSQQGFANEAAQNHSEMGMQSFLEQIKEIVETS